MSPAVLPKAIRNRFAACKTSRLYGNTENGLVKHRVNIVGLHFESHGLAASRTGRQQARVTVLPAPAGAATKLGTLSITVRPGIAFSRLCVLPEICINKILRQRRHKTFSGGIFDCICPQRIPYRPKIRQPK